MKLIKKIVADTSLNQKFSIVISVSILVCVAILSLFAFSIFDTYNKLLYQDASHILNMSIVGIENDLRQVEKITESILGDSSIQGKLPNIQMQKANIAYIEAVANIYEALNQYYPADNIISIAVYTDHQRIHIGWNYIEDRTDMVKKAVSQAKNAGGKTVWLSSGRSDSSIICARDIKQIENLTLKSMGVLLVYVDLKGIINKYLKYYGKLDYNPLISIISADEVLYANLALNAQMKETSNDTYSIIKNGSQKYLVTQFQKSFFSWTYTMYLPFNSIAGAVNSLKTTMAIVTIIVIMAAFYASVKIVSQIIKHFDVLVHKMQTFKKGDFTVQCAYDYSERNDELGFLHRSFDKMVSDIRQLINDNYVKQLLIRDAHIKSLQQQINPHFLFNILHTVNWMAKGSNQKEISTIVEAVGKMLRYSLDEQNNVVLLEKEMENTQNYITIQKMRYKDRLEAAINISPTLYKEKIPKMTLQAIVENAINHGLENIITTCCIRITTQENEDSFCLIVEDNGPGIEEDILEKLANNQVQPSGLGIGLMNIQQRIQLLFSNKYGITPHNTGNGTRMVIRLPKKSA